MDLEDFQLKKGNHFIAMEYYKLILNRTYLVLITDKNLSALRVNGLITVKGVSQKYDQKNNATVIKKNLNDPFSYVDNELVNYIHDEFFDWVQFYNDDPVNFRIKRESITSVTYDSKKKWGMSYYPHDGKVYVKYEKNKKREFIILGSQSGERIKKWIERKA